MKRNILLEEEIVKIKRLSGINEAASGPTQWIAKLIAQIANTPLSDDVIREFEPLVTNGRIAINKSKKTITSIDWANIADDEVELLFRSPEIAAVFKQIIKDNNIATTSTAIALYSPRFKKIVTGYNKGKGKPIVSNSSSTPGSTSNVPNTGGKYTGDILSRLSDLFGGRIDDATLQKILDKKSKLRLDLENELKLKVGKSKAHLVPAAIDKAARRVSELTEGLTEQTAYNKVFETAFTNIGIARTNSELFQKYFGWFLRSPWWVKLLSSAILIEGLNELLGTDYSLSGIIKFLFRNAKAGAFGDGDMSGKWQESVDRLKKSTGPENAPNKDSGKQDVTTY